MKTWFATLLIFHLLLPVLVMAEDDLTDLVPQALPEFTPEPLYPEHKRSLLTMDAKEAKYHWSHSVLHYRDAEEFKAILLENHLLADDVKVAVDMAKNSLWVKCSDQDQHQLKEMLKYFDLPGRQIEIEARIAFVDKDYEHELGMNFSSGEDSDETGVLPKERIALTNSSANLFHIVDSDMLDVQLAALEKQGHGEVISRPSLLTLNRKPALIQSGEEVPYQESAENGATTVRFKKAVLSLQVTPILRSDETVLLELQINQDKPSNQTVLGVPAIKTRQIKTQAEVHSGQTVVLGGIFEESHGEGYRRIPVLGALPIVGELFTYRKQVKSKRELLIFVTPNVLDSNNNEKSQ